MAHSSVVIKEWETLNNYLSEEESTVTLNGKDLSLGALVVVSGQVRQIYAVAATLVALQASLKEGQIIYGTTVSDVLCLNVNISDHEPCLVCEDSSSHGDLGVNTGFGGSADSRTKQVEELQRTLIRELHYGIGASPRSKEDVLKKSDGTRARKLIPGSSSRDQLLPEDWLLNRDVVPKIPLRGSISASGDLSPLSYVAGTIQGKSTIGVRYGSERGIYSEMTAGKALAEAKILPVTLTAKEGLAIVNGNAVSAGVAALALWETHNLAIMSQLLTAMAVEALSGTDENFDPAFGRVRPHPGQIDCLNNIHRFLEGSKLIHHNDGDNDALRQDRYSIRTASQWLGPVLEDFLLAHQQMHIEMNSVTDNPISTPTVIEFCTVGISRPRLLHQRLKRYGSLSKQLDACYSSNARK
ncbi:MAG: hypothetical protein Q9215_004014 [Flavoplaca cf. flavocitrina]